MQASHCLHFPSRIPLLITNMRMAL